MRPDGPVRRRGKPNRGGGRGRGGGGGGGGRGGDGPRVPKGAGRGFLRGGRGGGGGPNRPVMGGPKEARGGGGAGRGDGGRPQLGREDPLDRLEDVVGGADHEDEDEFVTMEGDEEEVTVFVPGKGEVKKVQRRKVEMQVVHMSEESQTRVELALRELYGGQYQMRKASSYKDTGQGLDRRFWVRDRQLMVRGVELPGANADGGAKDAVADAESSYALKKLEGCGFHSNRCSKALEDSDGDVGKALEDLLARCFDIPQEVSTVSTEDLDHCKQLMEDEKMALESIYGDAFAERIPGQVWEIKLVIKGLPRHLPKEESSRSSKPKKPEYPKDACKFYLNGHCKYGKKCRQKHIQPIVPAKVDDRHLRQPKDDNISWLEVRFQGPDRPYPKHPPLVCFYTNLSRFPKPACLNISKRLMDEAKELAKDEAPSVFALCSLLDSREVIDRAVKDKSHVFSFDEDLVPQSLAQGGGDDGQTGMASLSLSDKGRGDRRRREQAREFKRKEKAAMLQENDRIRRREEEKRENATMMSARRSLPAWSERDVIVNAVRDHQVTVISGMTGCGKSTQVPQYILDRWLETGGGVGRRDDLCNIICTQPRRISAIGVAERVAAERSEKAGEATVGYQIRMETKAHPKWTRLLFCTTGILLRRLESDPDLDLVTHVVVDEVHERSEESDFLLMILRDVVRRRPDLRVILMSATLNADLFSRYFDGGPGGGGEHRVPIIEIPGRTFPVDQIFLEDVIELAGYAIEDGSQYARKIDKREGGESKSRSLLKSVGGNNKLLQDVVVEDWELRDLDDFDVKPVKDSLRDEQLDAAQIEQRYGGRCTDLALSSLSLMDFNKIDYDLIESVLVFIAEGRHSFPREGAILVFLPGLQEITTLYDQLAGHPVLGVKAGRFRLIPLHSSLSSEEQAAVFERPGKRGRRKIVISTNLAETSITIDDCVFVVDAGRMKEKRFDSNRNMESLDTVWVSKANALQRKGRAGRVMPGVCFHLYTKFRYDYHFRKDPIPEIQRVPLEQMLLRIKILPLFKNKEVKAVLAKLMEPPEKTSVDGAVERLQGVGALDPKCELTPLGFHLALLPVDVRIGKLMLFGAIFRCTDAALTIAAALSYRSPFFAPFGKRDEADRRKRSFAVRNSDHLAALRAYQSWHEAVKRGHFAGFNYAQENFLSHKTLLTLAQTKHQFLELLSSIGFAPEGITMNWLSRKARNGGDAVADVTGEDMNAHGANYRLIVSVLCAALYPNIVQILSPALRYKETASGAVARAPDAQDYKFKTKADGYVHIHPSSVCHSAKGGFESPYLVFNEKIKTSRVFIREMSMVPIYPMIIFGGTGTNVQLQQGKYVLSLEGGWIKVVTHTHRIAELLKDMRAELDQILEEKIADPSLDLLTYPKGKLVINTIVNLITTE